MSPTRTPLAWLDGVQSRTGEPLYLAIVQALEVAIRTGALQAGERLAPQRRVADHLGINFTTVTRAYSQARDRGLVEGATGRGTFVRARALHEDSDGVDLSMNLPPAPEGISLGAHIEQTTAEILRRTDTALLMAYHPSAGALGHRAAGASWLEPVLGEVDPARVLVASGAQAALAAVLTATCRPGDWIVVEPLTYPGLSLVAARLGLQLVACPTDAGGPIVAELDRLCETRRPKALYLIPTHQNPTTVTLAQNRRSALAEVVARHDLWLVEDDPYWRLEADPLSAISSLLPQQAFFISTLSKTLTPGLRTAFVVCPQGDRAQKVEESLRALCLMPAPLMTAMVSTWIREGLAETLVEGVRKAAQTRRALARRILPQAIGADFGLHVWLPLDTRWQGPDLDAAARAQGLALVTAPAFATTPDHQNGMRISLGGPVKLEVLEKALVRVGEMARGWGG